MVSPGKVSSKLWTQTGPRNKALAPGGCVVWGQTWVSGRSEEGARPAGGRVHEGVGWGGLSGRCCRTVRGVGTCQPGCKMMRPAWVHEASLTRQRRRGLARARVGNKVGPQAVVMLRRPRSRAWSRLSSIRGGSPDSRRAGTCAGSQSKWLPFLPSKYRPSQAGRASGGPG